MLQRYAQVVGVGLLSLGGMCMLGVGTTNPAVDFDHLFVGALMAYAGFALRDEGCVRSMVAGLGLIYLLAGTLAYLVPTLLFGPLPDVHNGIALNGTVHLLVGASNLLAVVLLTPDTRPRGAEAPLRARRRPRLSLTGTSRASR